MIAEVVKGDRISRAGVAMFEKIAEVFKEEVVRQIVLSIRWRTIEAVQMHGSLRETWRNSNVVWVKGAAEVQDKRGRSMSLKTIAIPSSLEDRGKDLTE